MERASGAPEEGRVPPPQAPPQAPRQAPPPAPTEDDWRQARQARTGDQESREPTEDVEMFEGWDPFGDRRQEG